MYIKIQTYKNGTHTNTCYSLKHIFLHQPTCKLWVFTNSSLQRTAAAPPSLVKEHIAKVIGSQIVRDIILSIGITFCIDAFGLY